MGVEVGILDGESRLVLGPWLAALERKRPFVTLGYTVNADGRISGLPTADRTSVHEIMIDADNLRLIHDAVLLDNGQLEETILNGHGRDVFNLPTDTPREARDLLAAPVDGGVRSLLVDGTCSLARPFLEVDLVDQAVAYIDSGGPSNARLATVDDKHFVGLLRGFAFRDITRVGHAVRVSSARQW